MEEREDKDEEVYSKLLPYQRSHVDNLVYSISKYSRVLDSSECGVGKTFCAIATCMLTNTKIFVICPKSVISSWIEVIKLFKCPWYGIVNYETLQNGNYFLPKFKKRIKKKCPFVKRIKQVKFNKKKNKQKESFTYQWKIPPDALIVFDESHRCKNVKTLNSALLFSAGSTNAKIMMLSATVSDRPENFIVCGFVLGGFYNSFKEGRAWIRKMAEENDDNPMKGIHEKIFPEYSSRIRIKDLGTLFPENQINCMCYDMQESEEIEKQYKIIEDEIDRLKSKEESAVALAKIMYARMKIEQLKVPTMLEMINKFLEEGNAVAVFVNFTETLLSLAKELKTNCLVYGQQDGETRDKNVKRFNDDKTHIILLNSSSGSVGLSLHDTRNKFPRVSVISPSWSAVTLLQSLGRIHRANGKSLARQKIVFCKGTIEEKICNNIRKKITNLSLLNNGDTDAYNIEGLTDTKDDGSVGTDVNKDKNEFERTFQKISVLNLKKERLRKDLEDTEKEIKGMEDSLQAFVISNVL
jgi:superfamily II DNA or RNA helicase